MWETKKKRTRSERDGEGETDKERTKEGRKEIKNNRKIALQENVIEDIKKKKKCEKMETKGMAE